MENITLGYAFCGSFCTIKKSLEALRELAKNDIKIKPIMSSIVYTTDTRFGKASELIEEVEDICGEKIIHDIAAAEPIGPKAMTDIMVVAPCTSNTTAKLANSVTDTAVTMAVKSHLRQGKAVVLAIASNDSLLGSAKNIGELFNRKNYYFVPMLQDDCERKPASLVAEFSMLPQAIKAAMKGIQLRPIIYSI